MLSVLIRIALCTYNIHLHDKIENFTKTSLSICFHEQLEHFPRDSKMSLSHQCFESLKFYCIKLKYFCEFFGMPLIYVSCLQKG